MELPEISSPYPTPKKKEKRKNNNFKPGFKISSENQFLLCGYVNLLFFLNLIVQYVHWLFCFPRRGYEWTSESSHNNSDLMHGLGIDFVLSYKLTLGLTRFLLSSHMQIWFAKRFWLNEFLNFISIMFLKWS